MLPDKCSINHALRSKYEHYKRALCLLDPYGLHLHWDVIFAAGQSKAIEIFVRF